MPVKYGQLEVSNATDAELRGAILTTDGVGQRTKEVCLEELIRRHTYSWSETVEELENQLNTYYEMRKMTCNNCGGQMSRSVVAYDTTVCPDCGMRHVWPREAVK